MAELDPSVLGAVSNTNMKSVGEGPAFYSNLAMSNAVAHQQGMNTILTAAVGSITKKLTEIDIAEAASIVKAATGQDFAGGIVSILAALASGQIGSKEAQTTPPSTA